MNPRRRAWLLRGLVAAAGLAAAQRGHAAAAAGASSIRRGEALVFPRDHGAHVLARTEWWYATGWLGSERRPTHGFQVTFFRSRTGLAEGSTSRFAARHLLFAHAAITDLGAGRHRHAQRIARWSGLANAGADRAAIEDADLHLARWRLQRRPGSGGAASVWWARIAADAIDFEAWLETTQPPLLQGDAGFSRKGPEDKQASRYYSLPQLAARLRLAGDGAERTGRAWLDHEWSDELLHPEAVGWDWIGINLFDGSALTAFVLRRADGSTLWAGGSWRAPGAAAVAFAPGEVHFTPERRWRSPATNAVYPVQWAVHTPGRQHRVRALLDAQELDSRGSTGAVYWEGLAELLDERGARIGLGYLEMTGYAAPIRVG